MSLWLTLKIIWSLSSLNLLDYISIIFLLNLKTKFVNELISFLFLGLCPVCIPSGSWELNHFEGFRVGNVSLFSSISLTILRVSELEMSPGLGAGLLLCFWKSILTENSGWYNSGISHNTKEVSMYSSITNDIKVIGQCSMMKFPLFITLFDFQKCCSLAILELQNQKYFILQ